MHANPSPLQGGRFARPCHTSLTSAAAMYTTIKPTKKARLYVPTSSPLAFGFPSSLDLLQGTISNERDSASVHTCTWMVTCTTHSAHPCHLIYPPPPPMLSSSPSPFPALCPTSKSSNPSLPSPCPDETAVVLVAIAFPLPVAFVCPLLRLSRQTYPQ